MTRPGSRPVNGGEPGRVSRGRGPNALIWRWWNLLLLLPLLMLITSWFNKDKPRLFGMPFFYWYQLAFVFVGVACVAIVYAATRTPPTRTPPAGGQAGGKAGGKAGPDDSGARRKGVGR